MFNEKQKQESGNDSTNYQSAGDITINQQGMTFTEVKEVAMMVFKNNFVDLGEQVEELVNERAERFITDYLEKLMNDNPEAIHNTLDPDIRYSIFEAQKSYARSGKEDIEDLLIELLYERTISNSSDFRNILLNEALAIASKISKTQLEILSLILIMKFYKYITPTDVSHFETLILVISKMFISNEDRQSDYYHLSYLGCLSISIGSISFERLISTKNIIGLNNADEIKHNIHQKYILNELMKFWDDGNRLIQNSTLTPVGSALAMTHINQKIGRKIFDVSTII